jgi:hypothetical protein
MAFKLVNQKLTKSSRRLLQLTRNKLYRQYHGVTYSLEKASFQEQSGIARQHRQVIWVANLNPFRGLKIEQTR